MAEYWQDMEAFGVCAIEIGKNMSGYAFSTRVDFERDPLRVYRQRWYTSSLVSLKTPTCILIKPDGKTLHSFGYEAERKYADLVEDGEQKSYFFFKKFQLALGKKLKETFSPTITLEDEMGRFLPALDILAMSIRYFVDDLIATYSELVAGIVEKRDILFVLTVPTIWHDDGKTFMREAAVRAGVERKQLFIVLESEVVLPFFLNLSKEKLMDQIDDPVELSQAGTKFMVLDAGGTSVDITVNEIGKSGEITEIHAWCIDGCGSTNVNASFENMISSIISNEVYDKFKQQYLEDWTDLLREFEIKKSRFRFDTEGSLAVRLPISLKDLYQTKFEGTIAHRISKSEFHGEIKWMSDKMRISAKVFKSLYNDSMQTLIGHVRGILRGRPVTCLLMVGGYSESSVLQHAVKSAFQDIRVVIPEYPSLAVLKGAVIYGHTQKSEKNILVQIDDVIDGSDFLSSHNDGSDFIFDICCTPCTDDDKSVEAEYHCEKCQTYFCSTCVIHHNKVFKSHQLQTKDEQGFSQGHQQHSVTASSSLRDTCELHAGEFVKMYCQQHDIVCCTVCIAVEHRTCKGVHYIPDIAKRLLKPNEERSTLTSLKQMKSDLQQLISKRKGDMSMADKRVDGAVNEIKNVKAGIIQKAEKLERASIAKVQRLHGCFTDGINADIKSLENTLEGIDKKISEMDKKNIQDEAELFLRVKQSQNQIRNGCECRTIQSKDVTQISFEIDTDIAKNLDKQIDFLK